MPFVVGTWTDPSINTTETAIVSGNFLFVLSGFLGGGGNSTDILSLPALLTSVIPQIATLQQALFSQLSGLVPPNGTLLYCVDCKNVTDDTTPTFDSPAAGSGQGTNVLMENGPWRVH
jgi:hypothetical protein